MDVIKITPKKKKNYVDNKLLFENMVQYGIEVRKAKRLKLSKPQVPHYVGESILKIADHLSYKPNFINYPFREDMVGDGIENCLVYIDNFNPKKSKNPFAYFTQIIYFAYLRRISKERKYLATKYKAMLNSPFFQDLTQQMGDDRSYNNTYVKFLRQNMGDLITDFEDKKKSKKKPKKKGNLEKLL